MRRLNCTVLGAVLLLSAACGSTLNRNTARDVIRGVPELQLSDKDITVTGMNSVAPDRAVVDADLRAAFLMVRRDGKWKVEEVRLADRQWVELDRLRSVLADLRGIDTRQAMLELAGGLVRRFQASGSFPADMDIVTLTDHLHPTYLSRLVRTDAWGTDFQYQNLSGGSRYRLTSAGPDRAFHTSDDLVMVDGRILSPGDSSDSD